MVAILPTSSCPSFDATALLLQAAAHSLVSARVCAPLQYSLLRLRALHDKHGPAQRAVRPLAAVGTVVLSLAAAALLL
eukprot:9697-Heterococcus_DN1.PRE.6